MVADNFVNKEFNAIFRPESRGRWKENGRQAGFCAYQKSECHHSWKLSRADFVSALARALDFVSVEPLGSSPGRGGSPPYSG